MSQPPYWRRPRSALGLAGLLYAGAFLVRTTEVVDVEASDTLLAAPVALIAVGFGLVGGAMAGVLAALVFAGAEASDSGDLTWDEVVVRAVGFGLLGALVGTAATVLDRTRALFSGAFDNAPHGILLTDSQGGITAANTAVSRLLARSGVPLEGRTLVGVMHPLDIGADDAEWAALRAGETRGYAMERRLLDAHGREVPVMMAISRMPSATDDTSFIVHLVDLSAQRHSERELAHLADHDPLTGRYNRRHFEEELRRHLLHVSRHGATGAVLLIDIDGFKNVNDALGRTVGDVVLRAVGDALERHRSGPDVLARLGGDEFAVLLPDARTATDTRQAADDILAVIGGVRVPVPDHREGPVEEVRVSACIGAAVIRPYDDAERLLTAADLAVHEAMEAGRGRVRVHEPSSPHAARVSAELTWGERIPRALGERRFELHLQPIVALLNENEPRYEALLRLREGDRLWEPDEFLPHAERLDLMADLDRYVVDDAVRLLAGVPRHRRPQLELSLSGASLGDEHLHEWIAALLNRRGVVPANLVFEVTETLAVANMAVARDQIRRLRARGSGFALDHFGVGVSSFYYLRELPFDILKIDGQFVRDLPTNRVDQVIVRAVIEIAHSLGKTTVAEDVESEDVADILRRLGCDEGQGHHFGTPVPAQEIFG